jgi:hypothetical protein
MPAGTYYLWAGTDFSNIDPCPVDYLMTVTLTPCDPGGACCFVDGSCLDDLLPAECAATGGIFQGVGTHCANVQCPCGVVNDLCVNAELIEGPFPQQVVGTCVCATIDCPTVLNWTAVWYKVELPYANNKLAIQYCGTTEGFGTAGIVIYTDCPTDAADVTCSDYILPTGYTWNNCAAGGGYGIDEYWDYLAGPGYVLVPAYCVGVDGLPMEFIATFNVTSMAPPPQTAKHAAVNDSAKASTSEARPAPKITR